MKYRCVYYAPRPWLDERILVAVEQCSEGEEVEIVPANILRWREAIGTASWQAARATGMGADGPHRSVGDWKDCPDDMWPTLRRDYLFTGDES